MNEKINWDDAESWELLHNGDPVGNKWKWKYMGTEVSGSHAISIEVWGMRFFHNNGSCISDATFEVSPRNYHTATTPGGREVGSE